MIRKVVAVCVGGALGATALAAGPAGAKTDHHPELRKVVERLTEKDGTPGAFAETRDRFGRTVITSGVGDARTGAPMPREGLFRAGSLTKPFVATVVLQLAGEGDIDLDAPVERYLPGLITGNGNEGSEISVRQLLEQRTGLPDYLALVGIPNIIKDPLAHRDRYAMLRLALGKQREFVPGDKWGYSNTNYLVAALIVEKVTGNTLETELKRRVIKPLKLSDTSFPIDRTTIPKRHSRGYVRPAPGADLLDLTALNPSVSWGGGNLISSGRDINRFMGALVGGRLLRPEQQRALMTVKPTGRPSGAEYGLGLQRLSLPCGGYFWGHDGDMIGFTARGYATEEGAQVTVMANLHPGHTPEQKADLNAAVTTALCESK
ncbi:serine hydrolase domain-containing protein [Spirillospora sp. CA-294931]|uniref:serine hydrolase domain-containing protein n=1 Tax=Spirillospora sp. CA-294931 TaxID=3240042 RepID=UPI003D8E9263